MTTHTADLEDDSLKRDAARGDLVNEVEDLNQPPKDETALEMREQVIGRRRLEYPVMHNELDEPRGREEAAMHNDELDEPRGGEEAADAAGDTSDSENAV